MMTQTKLKVEFIEGLSNVLPNRGLSELVIANMREIGAPTYTDDEIKFAEEMAKTVTKEAKSEQLRASKRPEWEKLVEDDIHIDHEIHDPWDQGLVWPGSTDTGDVSWIAPAMEFSTATATLEAAGHDGVHNPAFRNASANVPAQRSQHFPECAVVSLQG